ncbi:DoxX family protein [Corynebacterium sp. 320]|uniref:DoxX family protein n=1 Tax=Corynebacterium zhongnanshanii TaxID=2768834 RepID=A0ABQ6VKR4_9CORY|nr:MULTISPECIES: DoxX family protein [Corynebacterium]KAB1504096.1 DoxX family protein [Corynebacterium sp. 320]KAB1552806.1 DoxX family protein [Corynebacterium sp. 321]KAB1553976.1 DoxX family protein [Corynebacterium sp. 319]KAB3523051.1 DoxX family protein [Corynebacterium zhongnanshanii]KAB3528232.1 DoxX family protein [Corynebacterium sp. 250]
MNHPAVRDAALLVLRLVLGLILIGHGWQKIFLQGMEGPNGTIAQFQQMGVVQPRLSAWGGSIFEMLAGAMLVVGLLTTAVALVAVFYFAAVMYIVHISHGLFVDHGGFEFVLLIIVTCLILVVFGPGRASLDKALSRFS